MPNFSSLTVFFPMHNEEAYIRPAVAAALETCRELVAEGEIADYEILVVDDASTDATGKIGEELAADDRHVRVVHHPVNRKLGGSLKTGFSEARGELVCYADADLPFDFGELRKACRLMRIYGADVVSAYRHDRTSEGPRRALYSWGYNLLVRALFHFRIRDVNFSFKLCRRRIFDHLSLKSEGSFIDAELLVRAHRLGYGVIQFGVDYFARTRGPSTLSSGSVILQVLREMSALRSELSGVRRLPPQTLRLRPLGYRNRRRGRGPDRLDPRRPERPVAQAVDATRDD
ncbi:MAG: glycosyltransferase family 2 protein [Actinomycetota bacterium]